MPLADKGKSNGKRSNGREKTDAKLRFRLSGLSNSGSKKSNRDTETKSINSKRRGQPFSNRAGKNSQRVKFSLNRALAVEAQEASKVSRDKAPHLIVEALAGTGKTTTLIEALNLIKGVFVKIMPSQQQKRIWDSIYRSQAYAKSICFVAFNKAIASELQARVPEGVDAMTMHSMGLRAINNNFKLLPGKQGVTQWRVANIIEELTGKDFQELRKKEMVLLNATQELVSLCKQNVIEGKNRDELMRLAVHYDVELNGSANKVFDLVPRVIERGKDVGKDRCVDYDDMIWLPIVLNLSIYRYDLLLVDEAQDLNQCQQQLALRAGTRLVLCGDHHQAIYGFAGADSESLSRMKNILSAQTLPYDLDHTKFRGRGCEILPLTITRRCGRAIVKCAQEIVPEFEAHIDNCEGSVSYMGFSHEKDEPGTEREHYARRVRAGDMVICRTNAPLVSECFKFLKEGRKAIIQGRDIGQGLIKMIDRQKANNILELVQKLEAWHNRELNKEQAKKFPNEQRLLSLNDKYDCLKCFCEDAKTVEEVKAKIESIFVDDKNSPAIKLSSIHKAKGLEERRVFFLMPKGAKCPHPMAKSEWQIQQEWNLRYVGETRAIEELIYVR